MKSEKEESTAARLDPGAREFVRHSSRALWALALGAMLCISAAWARSSPLDTSHTNALVRRGIAFTVIHHYQQAQACFDSLATAFPTDPAGPFFQAALLHSRMVDYETDEGLGAFAALTDKAIRLASQRIASNPMDAWSHFFRGAAYGYRAFHAAREGRYLAAWQDSQSSIRDLEMAVRLDSSLADAYLGIGTYKYWRGKLLRYLSWLPFVPEEREEGIRLVRTAIEKGRYSRLTGLSDLAWILIDAGRLDGALACAHEGLALTPESRFFLWPLAEAYYRKGDHRKAVHWYEQLLASLLQESENNHYNEIVCRLKLAEAYTALGEEGMARLHAQAMLNLPLDEGIRRRAGKRLARARALLERCSVSGDPR
ncbi:MAG: hypothetical protein ONB30_01840 [candidate division KSB1 bacterium]|nr:hypothetical protein [candidate division KSB1 bacterium]